MILDGRDIAERIYETCAGSGVRQKRFLAVFFADQTPATASFIKQKKIAAERLGIDVREYRLEPDLSQDDMRERVREVAQHRTCGGVVLQLPLPEHADSWYIANAIPPEKDLDLLSARAFGGFARGKDIFPPAVGAIQEICAAAGVDANALPEIAIIGKGNLVGKPAALWALRTAAPRVRIFDKGFDPSELASADLIISGTGQPNLFSAAQVKEKAIVIDFGYGRSPEGKLSGDFDPAGADERGIMYTPTPGGTGPVLVACLMRNFCESNKEQA